MFTSITTKARYLMIFVASAMLVTMLAACDSGEQGNGKPTIRVGSKQFTEQLIIGNMYALILEDAGYKVERKLNLGGTAVVHQAIVSGDLDVYAEYTGSALAAILKLPMDTNPQKVYDTVKAEYDKQFKLKWLDPLGFNDTYAIAMRKDRAAELGITKISDLKSKADQLTIAGSQEFMSRQDGLPGLEAAYGMKFKDSKAMDSGLVYQAVDANQVDVASGNSTDGRLGALGLLMLEDDLPFFPPYYLAPVVRQDTLAKDPGLEAVLNKLAGKMDEATIAALNLKVDDEKLEPEDVARTYLKENGYIK
ncbi:MAG TPA: glycine betaine ABC transporter substrate-binding protein [Chloroflexia bacterium]|nr:glycine betaine ABC transporter substrate-binding protein [Chloroflexia bacterium]